MIGNQRLQRQFDGLLMMGILMPETCWAVSVRQSNKFYDWLLHLVGCFIQVPHIRTVFFNGIVKETTRPIFIQLLFTLWNVTKAIFELCHYFIQWAVWTVKYEASFVVFTRNSFMFNSCDNCYVLWSVEIGWRGWNILLAQQVSEE
jgi:hypothetical protein